MIKDINYKKQTKEEMIDNVSNIRILHPQINHAYELVKYCHDSSGRKRKPELLFISGRSGMGKTTLCERYLKEHPKQLSDTIDKTPVLYIKTPIPATAINLLEAFLLQMGDPKPYAGKTGAKKHRLKKLLKACHVELIIVDEFQQFLLGYSRPSHAMRVVSDWLKNLIEETEIPVVLVGLPEAEIALRGNEQLNRRFTNRLTIEPFGFNTVNEIGLYKGFLSEIEKQLPFEEKSEITCGDMASRIYGATDGLVSFTMDLIVYSTEYALKNNLPCIKRHVLKKVYEQKLQTVFNKRTNPFTPKNYTYNPKTKRMNGTIKDVF